MDLDCRLSPLDRQIEQGADSSNFPVFYRSNSAQQRLFTIIPHKSLQTISHLKNRAESCLQAISNVVLSKSNN